MPCRTAELAYAFKNSEGNVRLEAAKGEILRQERVRCAIGVGGLTVIGTSGDGWCTLGDWLNIGDAGVLGCRSAKDSFCLNRTSWIERMGVLRWGAIVAGGGVARAPTTHPSTTPSDSGNATSKGGSTPSSITPITGAPHIQGWSRLWLQYC